MQVLFPLMVKVDQQIQRYSFSKSHFNLSPPLVLRGFGFTLRKNPLFPPRIFTRKHFWPGNHSKGTTLYQTSKGCIGGAAHQFYWKGDRNPWKHQHILIGNGMIFSSMSEQ
ncbi:hypothetical protein CEXT_406321, partial [Caerostris extrusa]